MKRLALACVAGFVLTGCGGGGGSPGQFGDDDESTPTPTTTGDVAGASSTPTAGATAESTPAANTYTVVAGDTLWAIAQQFGTTVEALAEANGILDPSAIEPGQVLTIPAAAVTP